MTFSIQPDSWSCGPFALKHALLLLGIRADESDIARVAGTDRSGTDEAELTRAAVRYGCDLGARRLHDAGAARVELCRLLADGIPTLLCIEQWDHWVVAAREEDGVFVVIDSRHPAVFRILPWEYLRELLAYRLNPPRGEVRAIYDLHPLVPRRPPTARPAVTLARARFLREWENRQLAAQWFQWVGAAMSVAIPRSRESTPHPVTAGEFFGRHEPFLLDRMSATNDELLRTRARRVLGWLRFVMDTYDLVFDLSDESGTIERVLAIVRSYVAGGPRELRP